MAVIRDESTIWALLPRANSGPVTVVAPEDAAVRVAVWKSRSRPEWFRRPRCVRHVSAGLTQEVRDQRAEFGSAGHQAKMPVVEDVQPGVRE
jgi:hypothetical protein